MKAIETYFEDFLQDIRLTGSQKQDLITGHRTLRERLNNFEGLQQIIVTTFLQGSYRRSTAVRPLGNKRADVDIIVVTNIDKTKITPQEAINLFVPFVKKHYEGKYQIQGRSIGIGLSYVDLDIVITSAPSIVDQKILKSLSVTTDKGLEDLMAGLSEWKLINDWVEPDLIKSLGSQNLSETQRKQAEWKLEPLHIPDREANKWEETHPLEQIRWTRDKNKNTNKYYVNVVKAIKWFRTLKLTDIKYPKGYPIEHMIGDCCPDGITGMAEGVCKTLENIVSKYASHYQLGIVPVLPDRGVPGHDVWKRISFDDFKKFYDHVKTYAKIAREAMNATSIKIQVDTWKMLFGDKFPDAPDNDDNDNKGNLGSGPYLGGFTNREKASSTNQNSRFA